MNEKKTKMMLTSMEGTFHLAVACTEDCLGQRSRVLLHQLPRLEKVYKIPAFIFPGNSIQQTTNIIAFHRNYKLSVDIKRLTYNFITILIQRTMFFQLIYQVLRTLLPQSSLAKTCNI